MIVSSSVGNTYADGAVSYGNLDATQKVSHMLGLKKTDMKMEKMVDDFCSQMF